jgi:hypothetical protein
MSRSISQLASGRIEASSVDAFMFAAAFLPVFLLVYLLLP